METIIHGNVAITEQHVSGTQQDIIIIYDDVMDGLSS